MESFQLIKLKLSKEISPNLIPSITIPCYDGGFLVQCKGSPWISRYDPQYNLVWRKEIGILPDQYAEFRLTSSPKGELIGVHGKNVVLILDDKGNLLYSQEHTPWKSYQGSDCYFAPTNREDKRYIWFFTPEKSGGGYLNVLDASNFSRIASLWQEDIDYYYRFYSTPDNNKVLIDLAAGQDGSRLLEAQVVDQKIVLIEYYQCADKAMLSFSPTGEEIVFCPQFEGPVEIFSFPDIEKIVEIDQDKLFEGRDEFPAANLDRVDYVMHFLSPTTIMVSTRYGRLLLIDRKSTQCVGELLLEGCNINAYDLKGKATLDPTTIFDYAGEIWDIKLTEKQQIIVIHTSGVIKIYDLPDDI
jgi:hypothetical protein